MNSFLENYHGLEERIKDVTFSKLSDWDMGCWLLFGLYGPFLLIIPARIYHIEDSWANMGRLCLAILAMQILTSILTRLLCRRRSVQRFVFKKLSTSIFSSFAIEEEDLEKALVYLNIK